MTPKRSLYRIERIDPRAAAARGEARPSDDAVLAYRQQRRSTAQAKADPGALHEAIATARREIAAIGAHGERNAVKSARDELAAIAAGTADATAAILIAAEVIDAHARELDGEACASELDAVRRQVTAVYEACTFQDIAGQRIAKLVKALGFLEDRLARAVTALDRFDACHDELAGSIAPARPNGGGRSLVNGPRTPGAEGHVSQADIDELFA